MSAPALIVQRFFDPHHEGRHCCPPPLICGACGAEGLASEVGGVIYTPPEKGMADLICESCAVAGPDELRKRLEAHARYLQDRAGWLLAMSAWAEITVDPTLYVTGPDELAC
jgi:hypothetical protein